MVDLPVVLMIPSSRSRSETFACRRCRIYTLSAMGGGDGVDAHTTPHADGGTGRPAAPSESMGMSATQYWLVNASWPARNPRDKASRRCCFLSEAEAKSFIAGGDPQAGLLRRFPDLEPQGSVQWELTCCDPEGRWLG